MAKRKRKARKRQDTKEASMNAQASGESAATFGAGVGENNLYDSDSRATKKVSDDGSFEGEKTHGATDTAPSSGESQVTSSAEEDEDDSQDDVCADRLASATRTQPKALPKETRTSHMTRSRGERALAVQHDIIYGSMIVLLPDRFRFGVGRSSGPGFSINMNVPRRTKPEMPKLDESLAMVQVGFVTDNCPPLEFRHAMIDRAGQIACAKPDLKPGHRTYTLVTKSGHSLPNRGEP